MDENGVTTSAANGGGDYFSRQRRRSQVPSSSSSGGGSCFPIDLGSHHELKLLRRLGEGGKRAGQDTWSAVLSSSSSGDGKCKHGVAVKRIAIMEDMDVVGVQSKLENLRRASMWCRNVCTYHGAVRMDGHLCLIMDRYKSSVQDEMQQNNGRLTLEQILRLGFSLIHYRYHRCLDVHLLVLPMYTN